MKELTREKFNSNNAWGFGGGIGTDVKYDNGLRNRFGTAYYRHTPSVSFNRWFVGGISDDYPNFEVEIRGGKTNTVFVYKEGNSYRAYWAEKKKPFNYECDWELIKTITI
jgi:hypothetical protein